jgi:hypothetical protein
MIRRPLGFPAALGVIVIQSPDDCPLGYAIADSLNRSSFGFGVRLLRLLNFPVAGFQEHPKFVSSVEVRSFFLSCR